ncbi:MAG: hypothetical protein M3Y64_01325 [Gemmatimonadota bacterium]|nr:hypothetical protein [Gemmatimonadota bacterium]
MRDITIACEWWPIMFVMNLMSAAVYAYRRLSARARAIAAGVLTALPPTGTGAAGSIGRGTVWHADKIVASVSAQADLVER